MNAPIHAETGHTMNTTAEHTDTIPQATPQTPPAAPSGRLTIDAPMRAFHWLFALSFTGAWLTAESERGA